MSWISEIFAEGEWVGSAMRFATEQEALNAGSELMSRWFYARDCRAVSSNDPVNYMFDAENWCYVHLTKPETCVIIEK
jgi:hypothetical protein